MVLDGHFIFLIMHLNTSVHIMVSVIVYVSLKSNYSILILFIKGPTMLVTEIWNLLPWDLPEIKLLLPSGGFASGSNGKESTYNAGDPGSVLWMGRCPGEGNGSPLQCSCLENSMDRGAWPATSVGSQSQT